MLEVKKQKYKHMNIIFFFLKYLVKRYKITNKEMCRLDDSGLFKTPRDPIKKKLPP